MNRRKLTLFVVQYTNLRPGTAVLSKFGTPG